MSYEYKRWLQMLVREHRNFGTEPSKEFDDAINELDEAYAKAKAWDEFKKRQQMMVVELPRDLPGSDKEVYFHKKALFVMDQCYRAVTHDESEAK